MENKAAKIINNIDHNIIPDKELSKTIKELKDGSYVYESIYDNNHMKQVIENLKDNNHIHKILN